MNDSIFVVIKNDHYYPRFADGDWQKILHTPSAAINYIKKNLRAEVTTYDDASVYIVEINLKTLEWTSHLV